MSEEQKNELVRVVMSQTTYTFDEAKICLEDSNYNVIKVVREFMTKGKDEQCNVSDKKDLNDAPRSKHQVVYGEIRKLMDSASNSYRKRQEMAKLYQQQADKVKAMKEAAALQQQQQQQQSTERLDDVD